MVESAEPNCLEVEDEEDDREEEEEDEEGLVVVRVAEVLLQLVDCPCPRSME